MNTNGWRERLWFIEMKRPEKKKIMSEKLSTEESLKSLEAINEYRIINIWKK